MSEVIVLFEPPGLKVSKKRGKTQDNSLAVAQQFPGETVVAVVGGMHLLEANNEQLNWT